MRADVMRAMRAVQRARFVPPDMVAFADADQPLSIGYGQTISQPTLVAYMTELLDLGPGDCVLEIGTGSGYQTAILAELGYGEVYSVELLAPLAEQAAARLEALGYSNVHVRQADGYEGWPEFAPYDAIIVTAAPRRLPERLTQQLAPGGRLVIPMGPRYGTQVLWKFVKEDEGETLKSQQLGWVAFVPLVHEGEPEPKHGRWW